MSHENNISSIIMEEGLKQESLLPWIQKSEALIKTSIELFNYILSDDDQRWHIINAWQEFAKAPKIRGIHREVAIGAKYLSVKPSYRNEYGKYVKAENLRQLCRATNNLGVGDKLQSIFDNVANPLYPNTIRLAKTDKITLGTRQDGITGCPEALYQIQLFSEKKSKYIGRLGFNMHHDQTGWVMSITNLQGIPDGHCFYEDLKKEGIEPFNMLVYFAKSLALKFDDSTQIRALKNPTVDRSALMNTVCKREGVNRVNFRRH